RAGRLAVLVASVEVVAQAVVAQAPLVAHVFGRLNVELPDLQRDGAGPTAAKAAAKTMTNYRRDRTDIEHRPRRWSPPDSSGRLAQAYGSEGSNSAQGATGCGPHNNSAHFDETRDRGGRGYFVTSADDGDADSPVNDNRS